VIKQPGDELGDRRQIAGTFRQARRRARTEGLQHMRVGTGRRSALSSEAAEMFAHLEGPQTVGRTRASYQRQSIEGCGRVVRIGGQAGTACRAELAERGMDGLHKAEFSRGGEACFGERSQHPRPLEQSQGCGNRHRTILGLCGFQR
jgi:hypothetical protein